MEGIFIEYENENSLRSFPFAAGCVPVDSDGAEIPSSAFVDACLYPINPSGTLYLSGVSKKGEIFVSDSSGVVMVGLAGYTKVVEMYSVSGMRRHLGTIVASSEDALSEFAFCGRDRAFSAGATTFSASCVFPISVDGVTSVDIGGAGQMSLGVEITNSPDDAVRVSTSSEGSRNTIRFDVVPPFDIPEMDSIREIWCVVDGQTPFRISKLDGSSNTVMLYLDGIDKETVCANAHRENAYEMADTCDCKKKEYQQKALPRTRQTVKISIPGRAESAFYLVTPNMNGYGNPISITLQDGVAVPKTTELKVEQDNANDGYIVPESELLDSTTSKGIVIQVPGLSGGEI